MDTPLSRPTGLDDLGRALVRHLSECFAGYTEVELTGPLAGVPRRTTAVGPRLLVEVRDGCDAHVGEGHVLVVCACSDEDVPRDPPPRTRSGRPVDVVEVRRACEVTGAVAEATAGDLPLVVDVRLSRAEAEELLGEGTGPSPLAR